MRLMRSICLMMLTAAAVVGLAAPAAAQITGGAQFQYQFADPATGTPIAGTTFNASPSTNFTLAVYLLQTAGDASFLTAQNGLFGAGVRVTYGTGGPGQNNPSPLNPGGVTGVISVTSLANIGATANPGFNDVATTNAGRATNADFAQFAAVSDQSAPVLFSSPQNNGVFGGVGARVLVGTFTFTPSATGGTTNLRAETLPVLSDTVSYNDIIELDGVISSKSLTVVVAAVPEPASLLGVAMLGFVAVRRLRRVA